MADLHPVPCQDCGSSEWPDWTLLPHDVFNAVCPGGNGYLCLPCFARRVLAKEAEQSVSRQADTNPLGSDEVSTRG